MTTENQEAPMSPVMVNEASLSAIQHDSVTNDLSSNDICIMFNQFLVEFERMEKSGHATIDVFLNAVEQIVDAVLSILPYKLLDPKVLYHPMMYFLHQMLVDVLDNWRSSNRRLNIQETDIFLKIVLIFVHAAEQAPAPTAEESRIKIRDLVGTKRFLFLIQEQVVDIVLHKPDLNDDPNICTLGLLTIKLLQGCPFYYSVERNQSLITDLVTNCIDSYDYIQAVYQLQHDQPLTDIDRFLLYTCWECLPLGSATSLIASGTSKSKNSIQYVCDQLLTRLERALNEPPPCTTSSVAYIFERCCQLLGIGSLHSFNDHTNHLIDWLTSVLQRQLTTQPQDQPLINVALEAFHNLSQNPDIRAIIKHKQLTTLFQKYTSTQDNEQRKLSFGILAEIMDEKEINNNPTDITAVFIDQLKQLKPQQYQPDLDSTLSTLKGLMQHDRIKNEITKQGGVDILISFVRDSDLSVQPSKQIEDALEILWSCTFDNPEVVNTLQRDAKLMARVNHIFDNAKENGDVALEKAADGLIWKVEKEEKFKEQQEVEAQRKKQEKKQKAQQEGKEVEDEDEEEDQYDLMISYSWADMDLAHRIFHHLTEKLGYKIWLDQEQMHGSTIEAMANAVDGAQFILMCMSETYKRSANCKSEAEYAFNRKKHIVPCKMKKDYTPDGWLGFILGTRLYIDFGTYEFEKAIELLDNEIQLQKKRRKETKANARIERIAAAAAAADSDDKKDDKDEVPDTPVVIKKYDNSENVSHWNEEKVRNFLIKHNLASMVPLCDGINGEELLDLYTMCKTNSTSMYRSLKFELLHGYHRILPISTFLRFVSQMRSVSNDGLPSKAPNISKTHEESFPDED